MNVNCGMTSCIRVIKAGFKKDDGSEVMIDGKLKTAAPWLFMPFEITDPVEIGPEHPEITEAYGTDWVSNAPSLIHHTESTEAETEAPATDAPETEPENSEEQDASDTAEAAPLPEDTESGEDGE